MRQITQHWFSANLPGPRPMMALQAPVRVGQWNQGGLADGRRAFMTLRP